jgi:hypothetical protein
MSWIVIGLFLLGPLVAVPLGMRLLEARGDPVSDRVLHAARLAGLPAALVLAVSFLLPAGAFAAALAIPWALVTAAAAVAALLHFARDPRRWSIHLDLAIDAAFGFLAVGGMFAFTDRLGLEPFGFAASIILLTAVHFHFAGFVLVTAGVLAFRHVPDRPVVVGIAALVIGIPTTALGFFGFPIFAWVGAILVADGGLSIGLATARVAAGLAPKPARWLARLAGASLLVSMPLAIVYATGVFIGAGWLDVATMARSHGLLNVIGFAIPAMVAWSIGRPTTERHSASFDFGSNLFLVAISAALLAWLAALTSLPLVIRGALGLAGAAVLLAAVTSRPSRS